METGLIGNSAGTSIWFAFTSHIAEDTIFVLKTEYESASVLEYLRASYRFVFLKVH